MNPSELLIRETVDAFDVFLRPGSHELVEAGTAGDDIFNEDGTVNVVLLRPGMGRGPSAVGGPAGRRIYTREVLERDAPIFSGWASYMNHDSPAARKARAGLPRPPTELAGQLVETLWNPDVTGKRDEELGFEKGGVVGRFKPATDEAEQLIRRVPGALKFSVFGQATGLSPGTWRGDQGLLVEGIEDDAENSSFDMVTKAGAGGEVAPLIESLADNDGHLPLGGGYGEPQNGDEGEIDMGGLTLAEALQSDEVKGYIGELVEAGFEEKKNDLVEAVREQTRTELAPELDSARHLRLATRARAAIDAAKLPEAFAADLIEAYGVSDDGDNVVPGRALAAIAPEMEGETVKKTAVQVLDERLEADIKRERNKLAEAAPSLPFGPQVPGPGADGATPTVQFGGPGSAWAERARDLGLNPENFGATKAPEPATT